MRPSNAVPTALNRTKSTLVTLLGAGGWLGRRVVAVLGYLVAALRRLHGVGRGVATRTESAVRGPVISAVRGPLWTLVVGRRATVSVVLVCLAPVLAAVAAWGVSATVGYLPLQRWLVETWTGSDPHAVVFLGAGLLVGLAAVSAAGNAGLLPTTLLVAAPLFGVALTRYGAVVTTDYGAYTVSLPDAVAFAAGAAAVGGTAVALVGYPLGAGLRRAAGVVRDDPSTPFGGRNGD